MEFENAFSRPGKEWTLEKMTQVMEINEISLFVPTISCCLKIGNILLVIKQKYASKRLGLQCFLVMENLNWLWKSLEKSLNPVIVKFFSQELFLKLIFESNLWTT